jgi:hypothetical protein
MATAPGAIRSKNFNPKEDADLMTCWLSVSTDGVVGANQAADQFWSRISELRQAMGHSSRSRDSMQSRFKNVLNKEISKFSGFFIQVASTPPTCTSFDDWVKLASALYNGIVSPSASDDCGLCSSTWKPGELSKTTPSTAKVVPRVGLSALQRC